jgi:hypothetical protein
MFPFISPSEIQNSLPSEVYEWEPLYPSLSLGIQSPSALNRGKPAPRPTILPDDEMHQPSSESN